MNLSQVFNKIWKSTTYRVLFFVFAFILVLFVFIQVFSDPILKSIADNKILPNINKNSRNHIEFNNLHYNLFTNSLNISNCRLNFIDSSSSGNSKYLVNIPSFSASGINWFRLLFGNGVSFSEIKIKRPEFKIYSSSNGNEQDKKTKPTKTLFDYSFVKKLPERLNPILVDKFEVDSANFEMKIDKNSEVVNEDINLLSLTIKKIKLDSAAIDDSLNLIAANNILLTASKIERKNISSGDLLTVDSLHINTLDSVITVKNLSFKPFLNLDSYFAKRKYRSDRYVINFHSINLHGIDFKNFMWKKEIISSQMKAKNFLIDILTDKRLPINPSCCPKMPNEILKNLDVKFDLKNINLKNGELLIKSLQDWSKKPAVLSFTNINTEINNICSIFGKNDICAIDANANLADRGKLQLNLKYPLQSQMLNFNYTGSLDSMSAIPLNNWLEVENLVRVKSGKIDKITFSGDVEDGITKISEKPLYHNISIKKLSKTDKGEETIASFLFNTFKLRKSNPDDNGTKAVTIFYTKKDEDAFLDVLWIPIRNGLGKVVGF